MKEKVLEAFRELGYKVERSGESFVASRNEWAKYTCEEDDDGYLCISIFYNSFGYKDVRQIFTNSFSTFIVTMCMVKIRNALTGILFVLYGCLSNEV